MKKLYNSPELSILELTQKHTILAGSPDGFNNTLDDTNEITPEEMLGRRHRNVWDDEEEEDF